MNRLNETTLVRLRDRLKERGQRPSTVPPLTDLPQNALELIRITTEYGPLCEAMYLMMAVDGVVKNVEREVLKGALRVVTDDSVRGVHIEAMLDRAARKLGQEGLDARLEKVIAKLRDDPVTSEVAFVLACAVALADDVLHQKERELLERLAEGLDIPRDRADELVEEVGADER